MVAELPGIRMNDLRTIRIIRLAVAVTIAMTIAQLVNWPLSFVAPVLTVAFLDMPIPAPTMRRFAAYLSYAVLSVVLVFIFVMLSQPYPLVFIPAYALAIFFSAYCLHKGAPLELILLICLALWILPIVGNVHEGLTAFLGACLLLSELVAFIIIQLAHGILPDPPETETSQLPVYQTGYSAHAARAAAITTITVVPAMTVFLMLNMPAQLVIMIYVGVISLQGSYSHSVYDIKKYLTANTIGGLGALIFYIIVVIVPEVHVMILSMLFIALLFAHRRFSDAADARYFGSALIGVIILISSSLGANADIDTNIVLRVLYIFLAGMYVIGVTSIIEPLLDKMVKD